MNIQLTQIDIKDMSSRTILDKEDKDQPTIFFEDQKENDRFLEDDHSKIFDLLVINLASPLRIKSWSEKTLPTGDVIGEVSAADTFNYRNFKPEDFGLFCEKIFGPIDDWECKCKKYEGLRLPGKVCEVCFVELTDSRVRRHRMGFIDLMHPVVHLWFLKGSPSYLSILLELPIKYLQDIIYCFDSSLPENSSRSREIYTCPDYFVRPQTKISKTNNFINKYIADKHFDIFGWNYSPNKFYKFKQKENTSVLEKKNILSEEEVEKELLERVEAGENFTLEEIIQILEGDYMGHKVAIDGAIGEANELIKDSNKKKRRSKQSEQDRLLGTDFFFNFRSRVFFAKTYLGRRSVCSGVQILKNLLDNLDLEHEIKKERLSLLKAYPQKYNLHSSSKNVDDIFQFNLGTKSVINFYSLSGRRLRILESFFLTNTDPRWMILTTIPVLPPDLRPLMELSGGLLVSSDLNELYRLLIYRNNRFFDILKLDSVPYIIIENEKRLLQQSVDALIENGKLEYPSLSSHDRPLRSLYEVIEGKYGRFRQNLLGKRVDYSGRSVIVVGPTLDLKQCGLPFFIITELFECQLVDQLIVELKLVSNVAEAHIFLEKPHSIVLKFLQGFIQEQIIILNRAPTLHKFGVQAFYPILVLGQAIELHPLVCSGFNADFDGDQMGVHIPLSQAARAEAKYLMRSTHNILSPADGSPTIKPAQDMVIGCYYLTVGNDFYSHFSRGHYFSSQNSVIMAYNQKKLALHVPIWIRIDIKHFSYNEISKSNYKILKKNNLLIAHNKQTQIFFDFETKNFISLYIRTTAGRVLFNNMVNNSLNFL